MVSADVLRYSAFATSPGGGNPAGVVLDAAHLSTSDMQATAADIGYSETAFITHWEAACLRVRFFSPEGEVDFCGHATIATAAALAVRYGSQDYIFLTNIGQISVSGGENGETITGSFFIPDVGRRPLGEYDLDLLLDLLGWTREDLHPDFLPAVGSSGNLHPILVAGDLERLKKLDYDFAALQQLSRARDWITLQLIVPIAPGQWRSRNPFPWGGIVEDPATGSSAAAFLGYLREVALIADGESITIEQGVEMGQPSTLTALSKGNGAQITGPVVAIENPEIF